jgi:hypothetical protein
MNHNNEFEYNEDFYFDDDNYSDDFHFDYITNKNNKLKNKINKLTKHNKKLKNKNKKIKTQNQFGTHQHSNMSNTIEKIISFTTNPNETSEQKIKNINILLQTIQEKLSTSDTTIDHLYSSDTSESTSSSSSSSSCSSSSSTAGDYDYEYGNTNEYYINKINKNINKN